MTKSKVFTAKMLWVASYLGGPLVAGYVLAHNYKVFGQQKRVQQAWIWSAVVTIVVFISVAFIPESVNIPNFIIPFFYTGIAAIFFHKTLQSNTDKHLEQAGRKQSWWLVIGAAVVGLIVTFVIGFVTFILVDLFLPIG